MAHPLHARWRSMHHRCANPNDKLYGGRGITVCQEWDDFDTFVEDMGACPEGHSLDRIDNSKGYSKDNCRWANASVQSSNRRPWLQAVSRGGHTYVGVTPHQKGWKVRVRRSYVGYAKTEDQGYIMRQDYLRRVSPSL